MVPGSPNFFESWPLFCGCVRSVAQPQQVRVRCAVRLVYNARCYVKGSDAGRYEAVVSCIGTNARLGGCSKIKMLAGTGAPGGGDRLEWTPLPVIYGVTRCPTGVVLRAVWFP